MYMSNDDRKITDDWGSWFAGFTDGEGCFYIGKDKRGSPSGKYNCRFKIDLRDDDKAILEEICSTLGIGGTCDSSAYLNDGKGRHRFGVSAIADCVKLVEVFERFTLRAKKGRDFSIWRCAVVELQKPVFDRNADLLEYYFHRIKEVRQYEKQDDIPKPIIVETQLMIDF